jgi:NAD kinase
VRPLLIPDGNVLRLSTCTSDGANLFADSHEAFPVEAGDRITVRKSSRSVAVLRPSGLAFAESLRLKLGWSGRPVSFQRDSSCRHCG